MNTRNEDKPDDRPVRERLIAKAKRLHREHDELTMAEIAARLGVGIHESTVWKWLQPEEPGPRVYKLSDVEDVRLTNIEGSAILDEGSRHG